MSVMDSFRNAVEKGDVNNVRIMMKNSLLSDYTFGQFSQMSKIAGNMPGLYETYNGEPLSHEKSDWTDAYLNTQAAKLSLNFCPERIAYIKEIISWLHPATNSKTSTSQSGSGSDGGSGSKPGRKLSYHEQKEIDSRKGKIVIVGSGLGAGAVAGGLIALAAETSVFGGILLGALAGGAIGVYVSETRK